jgi:PIN domain nuclease of toxin-antitoxin system
MGYVSAMKLLLDTCCIIWAVSAPSELSKKAKKLLSTKTADVFVSVISTAEIACAVERQRIVIDRHWKTWFRFAVEQNGWQVKNIDLEIIEEAYCLPGAFHPDPADRIITATARLGDLTILTSDQKILEYPHVKSEW